MAVITGATAPVEKFAVIVLLASIVTANGFAVLVTLPVQPVKTPAPFGVAVKVTTLRPVKLNVLVPLPVLIPAGLLTTLPPGAPLVLTSNVALVLKVCWFP